MAENKLSEYMMDPKGFTIKKWLSPILKDRFNRNLTIVERVSSALVTNQDIQSFSRLVVDIYESAYLKAVEDYRSQLEKFGCKIDIVAGPPVNP